jgi:DUF971 family protein
MSRIEPHVAPREIRVSPDKRTLTLIWPDDTNHSLSAHTLRVESPSAEVKGHFGKGGTVPVGKENVTIAALEPVGGYALQIVFSDGHKTGFYTWDYLRGMGEKTDA